MKPNKIQKVLIALDYGPTAQKVAEVGHSLAKSMGAEAILLHVIAHPDYYSSTDHLTVMGYAGYSIPLQLDSIADLKKSTQEFLDKSKHHLGDKSIQTKIEEGDFANAILKAAKELLVDIIVIGSHSRRWLEEILLGSVTEKVLLHTTTPLLIIPTKNQIK
jgi:nucleotide-binding universal stress UspA family protein